MLVKKLEFQIKGCIFYIDRLSSKKV